jgi:hypothetical protein
MVSRRAIIVVVGALVLAGCESTSVAIKPTTTIATPIATTVVATTVGPTTVVATTVVVAPGELIALDVLALVSVQNEHRGGYDRDLFPTGQATVSGCDLRAQVMRRDSQAPTTVDASCKMLTGSWTSPYDGVVTTEPPAIEVDHVVALKEAWDSGAWAWDSSRRGAFATDLTDSRTLRSVTSVTNGAKSAKDPSNWLPPAKADECSYLADWTAIKTRWGLSMDQSEAGRIRNVMEADCPGLLIAPWPDATPTPAPDEGPVPTTLAPTAQTPTTASPGPTTEPPIATTAAPVATTAAASGDIKPGAYCSLEGSHGTYNGSSYVCSFTSAAGVPYKGDRAHWRKG